MHFPRAIVLCVLLAATSPAAAFAQEKGDLGVVMGYPTSVGFVYHVSDRFAIRPEVTFAVASSESDTDFSSTEGDTWSLGFAVSGTFYVAQWDRVRSYINARYNYSHGETTTQTTLTLPLFPEDQESTLTSNVHGLAGMFGAQYALHDKFSVFGEVGLAYAHQRSETNLTIGSSSGHQFAPRTAVGVIFYF